MYPVSHTLLALALARKQLKRSPDLLPGSTSPKRKLTRKTLVLPTVESNVDASPPVPQRDAVPSSALLEPMVKAPANPSAPIPPRVTDVHPGVVSDNKPAPVAAKVMAETEAKTRPPPFANSEFRDNLRRERIAWGAGLAVSWLIAAIAILRVVGLL
jgi:hypothetical protein